MDKLLKGKTIISLVGAQGSGKSTLGAELAQYLGTVHLEMSNIVKASLDVPMTRDELWQTGAFTKDNPDWLGEEVAKRTLKFLPSGKKTIVLSGTREAEVHNFLRRNGARLQIIDVEAPVELRFKRLRDLGKVSNARHFLDKELREQALGLPGVKAQAKMIVTTPEHITADKQAMFIAKDLFKKGIKCN